MRGAGQPGHHGDADRAIALAPSLAAAHSVRAVVAITAWDVSGALREIGQARDLAPDNAAILASHGQIHGLFGRVTDLLDALRRAVSLDPLDAAAFRRLATELYCAGR